eukprot:UN27466
MDVGICANKKSSGTSGGLFYCVNFTCKTIINCTVFLQYRSYVHIWRQTRKLATLMCQTPPKKGGFKEGVKRINIFFNF